MSFKGGCFCGALRFESSKAPIECGYCHCSMCRKTTGAPVLAFSSFPIESFRYTEGSPTVFRSSEKGQREFCATCGTQICFRSVDDPETVDVNSGALDDANAVPPDHHIYASSKLEWVSLGDNLPAYEQHRDA